MTLPIIRGLHSTTFKGVLRLRTHMIIQDRAVRSAIELMTSHMMHHGRHGRMARPVPDYIAAITGSSMIPSLPSAQVNDIDIFILLPNRQQLADITAALTGVFSNFGISWRTTYTAPVAGALPVSSFNSTEEYTVLEGVLRCIRVSFGGGKSLNIIIKECEPYRDDEEAGQRVADLISSFDFSVVQRAYFSTINSIASEGTAYECTTQEYRDTLESAVVTIVNDTTEARKRAYSDKLETTTYIPEWDLL